MALILQNKLINRSLKTPKNMLKMEISSGSQFNTMMKTHNKSKDKKKINNNYKCKDYPKPNSQVINNNAVLFML